MPVVCVLPIKLAYKQASSFPVPPASPTGMNWINIYLEQAHKPKGAHGVNLR